MTPKQENAYAKACAEVRAQGPAHKKAGELPPEFSGQRAALHPHFVPKPCLGGHYWVCIAQRGSKAISPGGVVLGGCGATPKAAYERFLALNGLIVWKGNR